jgi:hypothetical protein
MVWPAGTRDCATARDGEPNAAANASDAMVMARSVGMDDKMPATREGGNSARPVSRHQAARSSYCCFGAGEGGSANNRRRNA